MRTSSLSEGITVTAKDREDLLADPSIRVGFEVEFVARFDGLAATAPRRTMSLTTVLERPKRVKNYFKIDFNSVRPLLARWIKKNADETQRVLEKPTVEESIASARDWFGAPALREVGTSPQQLTSFWAINNWATPNGRTEIVTKLLKLAWTPSLWFNELGDHIPDVQVKDIWPQIRAEPRYGWADSEHTQVYTEEQQHPTLRQTEEYIAQQLGSKDLSEPVTTDYKLDQYRIDIDGSVRADSRGDGYGIEIIGPPVGLAAAVDDLKKIFDWITENGHYTNESAGLHVGVSVSGQTHQVDKLKLLMLLGEGHLLQLFSRELNTYTQSHLLRLKKKIRTALSKGSNWTKQRTFSSLIQGLEQKIDFKKYTSVNFLKLDRGYIEFRIIGNQDYESRYPEIKDTILRYAFVLKAALDPTAFEREYQTELARLFTEAIYEVIPQYPDAMTKYAVLASSKSTNRSQTLSLFGRAQTALDQGDMAVAARILAILLDQANNLQLQHSSQQNRAAVLSYRLLLRKYNLNSDLLEKLMQQAKVTPDAIKNSINFLNQNKE